MVDLFPAGWTSVGVLKGVLEALAAEDVATLCRDNETSVLHNLQNTMKNGRHEGPRPGAAAVPRPAPLPIPKTRLRGRRARLPWGHSGAHSGAHSGVVLERSGATAHWSLCFGHGDHAGLTHVHRGAQEPGLTAVRPK